jgi:hypothetical protein
MSRDPQEVVRVFAGPLFEAEAYQQVLKEAGIESKVVGTDLSAGLGSALPATIELWVHQGDGDRAIAAIKYHNEQMGRREAGQPHPHPTDSGKPSTTPHRKEPHVKQDPLGE